MIKYHPEQVYFIIFETSLQLLGVFFVPFFRK
nr:MAG TPA: hypothetical protein [Caudoviricetes sp.]